MRVLSLTLLRRSNPLDQLIYPFQDPFIPFFRAQPFPALYLYFALSLGVISLISLSQPKNMAYNLWTNPSLRSQARDGDEG